MTYSKFSAGRYVVGYLLEALVFRRQVCCGVLVVGWELLHVRVAFLLVRPILVLVNCHLLLTERKNRI